MVATHFLVLGIWLVLWVVFGGWGTAICRVARCDRDDAVALLLHPWIGLGIVVALLQVWHFVAPVNGWAFAVVCAAGAISGLFYGASRVPQMGVLARRHPVLMSLGVIAVIWLVNRSLNSQEYTDHGLYYLNVIRWNSDYRIVPGLANLHNRLAFNNSNFLLHSMLEVWVGRGYSAHVLNGFMAALAVPIVFYGLRQVILGSPNERQVGCFTLALAMVLATSVIDRRISSATPDFPAALLVTVAAWRLMAIGVLQDEVTGVRLRGNLLLIAVLAAVAITMKTTVIFFAGVAGIALAACVYRVHRVRERAPAWSTAQSLAFVALWAGLVVVPWMVRGYVLSGYPLFPSTAGGLPVDWAYDPEAAAQLREDIYAWARTYHLNTEQGYGTGWDWVPDWLVQVVLLRAPVEVVLPVCISLACLLWLSWKGRLLRQTRDEGSGGPAGPYFVAGWLALAYAAAILLWFLTAPSPRMGSFAVWGLAATLLGVVVRLAPSDILHRFRPVLLAAVGIMLVLPMLDEAARIEIRYRKNPNLPEFGSHFYEYLPFVLLSKRGDNGFAPLPKGKIVSRTTKSGLVVYLAETEADGKPGLLWDSPLPAARFFDPDLELRRTGELQSGFKTLKSPAGSARATIAP
jgi:hypothetical protein